MTPTSAMREPTKAERETAEAVYLAWCARGGWDWRDLVAKALAAVSDEMKERAAEVICSYCAEGHPMTPGGYHTVFEKGRTYTLPCLAARIRALTPKEPKL